MNGGNKKRKDRGGQETGEPPPNKFLITFLHGASRLFSVLAPIVIVFHLLTLTYLLPCDAYLCR